MTGDINDIKQRIRSALPPWFGNGSTPILNAIVAGLATAWTNIYSLCQYIAQQTRIKTASGGFLDIVSVDFFGNALPRGNGESDTSFRARILSTLLQEKGTRWAIYNALFILTGRAPLIIEPSRPADTGSYRSGGAGYSAGGAYGSLIMAYQAFVVAYRQSSSGVPNIAGYGVSTGAYGIPSQGEYVPLSSVTMAVQDAALFAAVDAVKPAGTAIWMRLSN
jgi:hypothetical protein